MAADEESVSLVVREYQYNIRSFFVENIEWGLLNERNNTMLRQIIKYGYQIRGYNQEGKFLHSVTKRHVSLWGL